MAENSKVEQPDIVDQLRDPDYAGSMRHLQSWYDIDTVMASAASEIERLRQELAEARERESLHRADATCAWKEAEALRNERDEARHDAVMWKSNAENLLAREQEARAKALEEAALLVEECRYEDIVYPETMSDERENIVHGIRSLAAGKEG